MRTAAARARSCCHVARLFSNPEQSTESGAAQDEARRVLDAQRGRHARGRRRAAAARRALRALDPGAQAAPGSAGKAAGSGAAAALARSVDQVERSARLEALQAAGRAVLQARAAVQGCFLLDRLVIHVPLA
jgi:hypothetical protein